MSTAPLRSRRENLIRVAEWLWRASVPLVFGVLLVLYLVVLPVSSAFVGVDSRLYFDASQAWVNGGDPWKVQSPEGVWFAAPPPALLLNLPLIPFGKTFAVGFWLVADLAAVVLAVRRYKLPWWWLAYPPFVQGTVSGSADIALLGLVMVGGGALTAIAKPYAVPGMLGELRWRALIGAAALGVLTIPLLPWQMFLNDWQTATTHLADQSVQTDMPLLVVLLLVLALVSLGRDGLTLATPALWPHAQSHYYVWSLRTIRKSRILALATSVNSSAPLGVLAVANLRLIQQLRAARLRREAIAAGLEPAPAEIPRRSLDPRGWLQGAIQAARAGDSADGSTYPGS
jgi:hypothetical protein